jgi:photosystem II stability/assembly factor-like uncharacterized protein
MKAASKNMRSSVRLALLGVLLLLSACDDTSTATSTASTSAKSTTGPTITGIDVKDQGNGIVALTAHATDPISATLAYRWNVDAGSTLGNAAASIQWKVPSAAGTYNATVNVTNGKGQTSVASQKFTVSGQGTVSAAGTLSVTGAGNGQFNVPTAVGGLGVPATPAATNPTTLSPVLQPFATPAAPNIPQTPPLQPFATPTPFVAPPPPVASPLPTPLPPTPKPGVPVPQPVQWIQYDTAKIPTRVGFRGLHFTDANNGWIVGMNGTALQFQRPDTTTDPNLVLKNVGISPAAVVERVHFNSAQRGFASTEEGEVYRTLNNGTLWEPIGLTNLTRGALKAMAVVNDQTVFVADLSGNVFLTQSANAANAADVNWQTLPTKPDTNTSVWPHTLVAAATFPDTPQVAYFAGDGIYKIDLRQPAASQWSRLLQFRSATAGDRGDGLATDMAMISSTEIWVSTDSGEVLRSFDAGSTWIRLSPDQYYNRENNGNGLFLPAPVGLSAMSVLDSSNVFVAIGGHTYDSRDAAKSWRSQPMVGYFASMQILNVITNNVRDFIGFGVTSGGDLEEYRPGTPIAPVAP